MTFSDSADRELLEMLGFYIRYARQSIVHANEAIALLKMSRQLHEAKRKGLIDKDTANEAICRLNTEAAIEIEAAVRLQKMAIAEQTKRTGN